MISPVQAEETSFEKVRGYLEETIAEDRLELPLLPDVAAKVLKLTSSEDCDFKKLTDAIRSDNSMAAHVLRWANSPLYRTRGNVVSLQQALTQLGMSQIRTIALVVSCQTRLFNVRGHEGLVRDMMQHSLASAIAGQAVARRRRSNVEEAFLCGLLHDVGRPVLLQVLVDAQRKLGVIVHVDKLLTLIDREHANVGKLLAEKWALTPAVAVAIQHHHHPLEASPSSEAALTTSLADALGNLIAVDPSQGDDLPVREHPSLAPLNLYPEDVDALLEKRAELTQALRDSQSL